MKSKAWICVNLLVALALLLAACGKPTSTPTPTIAVENPLYLSLIWHQHQPVYYKDPETGIYAKPWVRVHAAKDYVDMAAMLKDYPNVHVTFNLTPSLIRQLDDFAAGAKDLYWVTAEVPADQLTMDQKQFLLDRFFDTNRKIIAHFPRYQALLEKHDAGGEFTTQDFLDLQVLFNLAWTDPDWLSQEPLASLVTKGSNFQESDKAIVFAEHLRLIKEVIPIHKQLQDAGQIEVTMTPYAHPILPLLISTDLAKVALPNITLPTQKFAYGQDAVAQIQLGVQLYKDHFGMAPRGMWPAEGSVAQEMVNMVSAAGIKWMASDEGVLAASLGLDSFPRNNKNVVDQADVLYRPYYVQGKQGSPVAIVFRDQVISDLVGFTYSGIKGSAAAKDFINRIHAIRESLISSGKTGPYLVSVILDGENAWENYDNDGKEFLQDLYAGLNSDPLIHTVTPDEFLNIAPDQPKIDQLWAGSWINHDFSTWIGEEEENRAWDVLATTRAVLQKYMTGVRPATPEALQQALNYMYVAEGSDWFWWFGSDQNSGNDQSFDQQYRDTLKQVYVALGETPPNELGVPIIPLTPAIAEIASTGLISPTIDGTASAGEWIAAGLYQASGGTMASGQPYFQDVAYGFSSKDLYLKIAHIPNYSTSAGSANVEIYLQVPGSDPTNNFSRPGTLLGFPANRMVELLYSDGSLSKANLFVSTGNESWGEPASLKQAAQGSDITELAVPLSSLGNAETGDRISLRLTRVESRNVAGLSKILDIDILPGNGPAQLAVPDLGTMNVVFDVIDPGNDDHGPGTYTYPLDTVFPSGVFDILGFQVGSDADNIVFKFTMRGPIDNPWGSPNGLSVQTFDIYIDKDGDGQGEVNFLPGRNLALQDGFAWDFAITIEGWESGIYVPGANGLEKIATSSEFQVLPDSGQRRVTVRIPRSILGDNPGAWKYAAMVLGQEGYPSSGVQRVRDVNEKAEQWRFGGGPADTNHTRVIDLVWSEAGTQEGWLGTYAPSQTAQADLVVTDFARVGMLVGK